MRPAHDSHNSHLLNKSHAEICHFMVYTIKVSFGHQFKGYGKRCWEPSPKWNSDCQVIFFVKNLTIRVMLVYATLYLELWMIWRDIYHSVINCYVIPMRVRCSCMHGSQWLPWVFLFLQLAYYNVDGIKDLWCSSIVQLLSTQTEMKLSINLNPHDY